MKKVVVIFNGGTISMRVDERIHAAIPTLKGEEVMSMVTGIEEFAEIESYDFSNNPGPHMTPKIMLELSNYIKKFLERDDVSGVVVTHGTDSLEETAYLLDLTIDSDKPVIVTGAMRNSSELGYDGPANLAASICTAISDESRKRGVLVCMNNEVHLASQVTKSHSMNLDAFRSPEFGSIGIVDDNKVLYYRRAFMTRQFITSDKIEDKVALIKAVAGDNSDVMKYLISIGYKGFVIEGMGRGNVPPAMLEGIKMAIDNNLPVVLVSRCFNGRVLDSYGYEGGGKTLRNMGVIFGDDLCGQKARIKLMLALGENKDLDRIKEIFEEGRY